MSTPSHILEIIYNNLASTHSLVERKAQALLRHPNTPAKIKEEIETDREFEQKKKEITPLVKGIHKKYGEKIPLKDILELCTQNGDTQSAKVLAYKFFFDYESHH